MSRNCLSLDCEIMNDEKAKLLRWVIECVKYPKGSFNSGNIDASELVSLMQCLGFTLENFEKVDPESFGDVDERSIKVEIVCKSSNMKAALTKPLMKCNCPSKDDANNAHIWNVSGCEPQSEEVINVSNTSILPVVSPTKNKIIGGLLQQILQLINDPDIEKKVRENSVVTNRSLTRHKSLESVKVNSCAINLNMNPAWETPTGSPPKLTSSPLPEVASLNGTPNAKKDRNELSEILQKIIKLSEEAYELTASNDTNVMKKRLSDIKVSPLVNDKNTPCKGTFINMNKTHTKELSLVKNSGTPKKLTPKKTPLTTPADKKKLMLPPSRLTVPKRKPIGFLGKEGTATPPKPAVPRAGTPRPSPAFKGGVRVGPQMVTTPSGVNTPMGVSKLKTGIPKMK